MRAGARPHLRQGAGPHLRVTEVSSGFVDPHFADTIADPAVRAGIEKRKRELAIGPDAIPLTVAFAMEQPANVEVGSIAVCPTAQD